MNGDGQLVVLDGSTVFVSQRDGDCPPSQEAGFFRQDVRHLSAWRLRAHAVLPEGLTRLALHGVPVGSGRAATDHQPDRPCPAKGARP